MARAAKFRDDDILNAALELVSEDGAAAATAVGIANRLGAPSGSIYHRFASRDLILATLWVRTVRQFQRGFLAAFDHEDCTVAATKAVTHTLTWSAAHSREAKLLTWYRRDDLIALWPAELGADLAGLNDDVKRAIGAFTTKQFGATTSQNVTKSRFALVDIPYAAVRAYVIPSGQAPTWLVASALNASRAVLTGADPAAAASPGARSC